MNISHTIEKITQYCVNTGPSEYSEGPRDAAIVTDTSSSMGNNDWSPSRLKAAQEAAEAYAIRLLKEEPKARVSIIAYDNNAKLMVPLTPVSKMHVLKKAINSLKADGCTSITSGLSLAYDQLKDSHRTCHVVLLSDGWNNIGKDPRAIAEKLKKHAVIDCIGIGGHRLSVDESLLKCMASSYPDGSKRYRWIGDKEKLVRHFHNLAGGLVRAK
jgi:Mg-chelatase subunit ChlD